MERSDPAEQLAAQLRADLGHGEYHPRERLVESELVARYGFPRATVRSALLLLGAEGLVERAPNRGASVRGLSIEEGIELAEVRRELEGLTARDAAVRATEAERDRLRASVETLRHTAGDEDVHGYRQASIGFHETIIAMSRHDGARRQLETIRLHNLQRHFPGAFQVGPLSDSAADHLVIADAVIAADGESAERSMRDHLDRVVHFLEAYRDRRAAS